MQVINLIGQLDGVAFCFAVAFITFDVVTGYAQAVANHCVSSKVMKAGFWHKLALVFAMLAAGLADLAASVEIDLGFQLPLFEAACGYVCLMELMSICENITKMNPSLAESRLMGLFAKGGEDEGTGIDNQ